MATLATGHAGILRAGCSVSARARARRRALAFASLPFAIVSIYRSHVGSAPPGRSHPGFSIAARARPSAASRSRCRVRAVAGDALMGIGVAALVVSGSPGTSRSARRQRGIEDVFTLAPFAMLSGLLALGKRH